MSMTVSKPGLGRMAATLMLPCMSFYALRALFGLLVSEGGESLAKHCEQNSTLTNFARVSFTGSDAVDHQMCVLVTFMQAGLDEGKGHFFPELYSTLAPSAVIPFLEMRRAGFRTPVVQVSMLALGFLYQNYSGAAVLPLWWAIHLWLSGLKTTPLHPHYVEGTFIGHLLGYLAVSVALFIHQTLAIHVAWQVFPASVVAIQAFYLVYQRYTNGDAPESSHDLLQLIHLTNFCWSAITHSYTLLRVLRSPVPLESLKHAYYPSFSPSSLSPMTSMSQHFLKLDLIFIPCTTFIVGLWYLRCTRSRLLATCWFVLGSICFGMGAAVSGIWMWREKLLEEDRRALRQGPKED